MATVAQDPAATILFRDRDGKCAAPFGEALRAAGVDVRVTRLRSPNLQAYIERWIQSVRVECLDRVLALGEAHFNFLVSELVAHYNLGRPHQSLGNRPLPDVGSLEAPILPFPANGVVCRTRLGGLLKSYARAA